MPRSVLSVAFVGIAAFLFLFGAEFVGLVQIFVYVGAVAVLIVFTILLTRTRDGKRSRLQLERRCRCSRCFRRIALGDSSRRLLSAIAAPTDRTAHGEDASVKR